MKITIAYIPEEQEEAAAVLAALRPFLLGLRVCKNGIKARSNAPVEYRGRTMTRYEASQKQRQLETAIRYAKDERDAYAAAGDKIGAAQARKRSAALGREYKSFCEQAGGNAVHDWAHGGKGSENA